MFQPYELFVGLRYTRAKRRNHFISFISLISMAGIALGVTALITVLSVMNGFEQELRDRILGMASHVTVSGFSRPLFNWPDVIEAGKNLDEHIIAAAPYVQGEAMLKQGKRLSGTMIRGVLPDMEATVSDVGEHFVEGGLGELTAGSYNLLLGGELARSLGVTSGDKIDLMIPQASVSPVGLIPRFRRFTVAGIFEVGMYEYDRGLVIIHLEDAKSLYRLGEGVTGVRFKLDDVYLARQTSKYMSADLPPEYYVTDWTRQHANFFRAIRTEKTVMFIILSLIVAVAAFNIVSTLVMVVTDKQADIAILRTLGASPASIMAMFIVQGSLIGVIGTLLGIVGGSLLAINVEHIVPFIESIVGQDLLSQDVYYINELKGQLNVVDVMKIGLISLFLSLVSTLYPAWRASVVQPAEALRYE